VKGDGVTGDGMDDGIDVANPHAQDVQWPLVGVASGMRSCLVKGPDGQWYRLKGCGNNTDGVVVRQNAGWRDLRGVAFPHTALRELYYTSRLAEALQPHGLLGANIALGHFLYSAPNAPLGETGDLRPACIIERTLGDRRLGTHVLAGLGLLLPRLLQRTDSVTAQECARLFPPSRPGREHPGSVTTAELMSDLLVARELFWAGVGDDTLGIQWPDLPRDEHCLANAFAPAHPSNLLRIASPHQGGLPDQWTAAGKQPMGAAWALLWARASRELQDAISVTPHLADQALAYLFGRIGHECGSFLGALHREGVSWGTYQDGLCFRAQWHCNAHTNNFVMLPRGAAPASMEGKDHLLGYVDLDMAFDEASFVNLTQLANAPPVPLAERAAAHRLLLEREHINFMDVLAGGDSTSGVPQVALGEIEKYPPAVLAAHNALHDTLILAYQKAYTQQPPLVAFDSSLQRCARALIELAITIMGECEA